MTLRVATQQLLFTPLDLKKNLPLELRQKYVYTSIEYYAEMTVIMERGIWYDEKLDVVSGPSSDFTRRGSQAIRDRLIKGNNMHKFNSTDLEKSTLVIVGAPGSWGNFGHFLGDLLGPALWISENIDNGLLAIDRPVMVFPKLKSEGLQKAVEDLVQMLFREKWNYCFVPTGSCLTGNIASANNFTLQPWFSMPQALQLLRENLRDSSKDPMVKPTHQTKRNALIICRISKNEHDPNRDIDETSYEFIEKVLVAQEFNVEYLYPTKDSNKLAFAKVHVADLTIGVLGASLARIIACRSGSGVIAILPEVMPGIWFHSKCECLGLVYEELRVDDWRMFNAGVKTLGQKSREQFVRILDRVASKI